MAGAAAVVGAAPGVDAAEGDAGALATVITGAPYWLPQSSSMPRPDLDDHPRAHCPVSGENRLRWGVRCRPRRHLHRRYR